MISSYIGESESQGPIFSSATGNPSCHEGLSFCLTYGFRATWKLIFQVARFQVKLIVLSAMEGKLPNY